MPALRGDVESAQARATASLSEVLESILGPTAQKAKGCGLTNTLVYQACYRPIADTNARCLLCNSGVVAPAGTMDPVVCRLCAVKELVKLQGDPPADNRLFVRWARSFWC